jgi:hypothetical protein
MLTKVPDCCIAATAKVAHASKQLLSQWRPRRAFFGASTVSDGPAVTSPSLLHSHVLAVHAYAHNLPSCLTKIGSLSVLPGINRALSGDILSSGTPDVPATLQGLLPCLTRTTQVWLSHPSEASSASCGEQVDPACVRMEPKR